MLPAGVVNQDTAHCLGGGSEKTGAVLIVCMPRATSAQPRLMHQCGRLEGLAGQFARHLRCRELAQLRIDPRQQLRGRLRIVPLGRLQHPGNVTLARILTASIWDRNSHRAWPGVLSTPP